MSIKQTNFPKQNQLINVDKLNPKGIFFSNNDNFVSVIGSKELIIIETKTGKVSFRMLLPDWKVVESINIFGHDICKEMNNSFEDENTVHNSSTIT